MIGYRIDQDAVNKIIAQLHELHQKLGSATTNDERETAQAKMTPLFKAFEKIYREPPPIKALPPEVLAQIIKFLPRPYSYQDILTWTTALTRQIPQKHVLEIVIRTLLENDFSRILECLTHAINTKDLDLYNLLHRAGFGVFKKVVAEFLDKQYPKEFLRKEYPNVSSRIDKDPKAPLELILLYAIQRADVLLTKLTLDQLGGIPKDSHGLLLNLAIETANHQLVRILLSGGANPDSLYDDGDTLYTKLVAKGRTELANALLDAGANPTLGNALPALLYAVANDKKDVIAGLIRRGMSVNTPDSSGRTALIHAAQANNIGMVKYLVELGASIHSRDHTGMNAAMWAAAKGQTGVLRWLVQEMRTPNDYDHGFTESDLHGFTALMHAAQNGHLESVELLLKNKARYRQPNHSGETALMLAIQHGHFDVARLLLQYGADPNDKSYSGETVLVYAMRKKDTRMIQLLLGYKINLSPSLDYAARQNDESMVRSLIDYGATVKEISLTNPNIAIILLLLEAGLGKHDRITKDGETPLMMVAERGDAESMKKILESGSSIFVNMVDDNGDTALIHAVRENNVAAVRALLQAGADPSIANRNGFTAFRLAKHPEIRNALSSCTIA